MWVYFNESISKDYSKKYRLLQSSLNNHENYELRLNIIADVTDPFTLTKLNYEDLAPKSVLEKKEQSRKKFFDE